MEQKNSALPASSRAHIERLQNEYNTFLDFMAEGEEVTFQTFDDKKKDRPLARIIHGDIDNCLDTLNSLNKQGAGIYWMVNRGDGRGRKKENVLCVRAVFIDLDGTSPEPAFNAPLQAHAIIESSPGKYHFYWLVDDLEINEFTPLQEALAEKFNSDPSVKDVPRVMRIPGFYHNKAEPFLTRIVEMNPGKPYTKNQILKAFELSKKPQSESLVCDGELTEGARNVSLTSMAGSMRQKGFTGHAISAALMVENRKICNPPLPVGEVNQIARSIARYKPEGNPENLTDLGNAKRLVNQFGENIRYCHEIKKWLVWKSPRWIIDDNGMIDRLAKQVARSIYQETKNGSTPENREAIAKHAARTENVTRLEAMIKLGKTEPGIPVSLSELDSDHYLLAVNNGVINLKKSQMIEADRTQYINKRAHVDYIQAAECPTWLSCLDRVFAGDTELIAYVQRAFGYSLTGDTREQVLFFLHGTGANGKSTLVNAIKEILGDHAQGCAADTLMVKQAGTATNDIAKLRGSRVVISPETEEGRRMAETTVKQLTGGDTISARFLFGEYFEFIPTFKIWIIGNHKPVIRGNDYGIWRRIMLIPFNQIIPEDERDHRLPEKLRGEHSGIFNWMLAGCLTWQREGLRPPAIVTAATKEYQTEMDIIESWMNDRCERASEARSGATALYTNYKIWSQENSEYVITSTKFGLKLTEKGLRKEKSRSGAIYLGIRLKEETWQV